MKLIGFSFPILDATVASLSSSELLLICMRLESRDRTQKSQCRLLKDRRIFLIWCCVYQYRQMQV